MSSWLLIAMVTIVLYGLWMLLDFVFQMIDVYHQREPSAADPRRGGEERNAGAGSD